MALVHGLVVHEEDGWRVERKHEREIQIDR